MENKEFGKQLEKRTKEFAIDIIRLSITLPDIPKGKVIRNQLTKSGTSVGANYWEANRARSKADFKNKISICESEASETSFWLEVIEELGWGNPDKLKKSSQEISELLAIFTTVGKNLKL